MATRGRKPKSVAEKKIAGNPGRRSLQTAFAEPLKGDLMCPNDVMAKPRAKAYWQMYLANAAPGHLAPIDAPLLARLCMALAWADEATELMEQTGMLVKSPNGLPLQSPYFGIINRQTEMARKLAAELALPVAQRSRVVAGPRPGANAFDDL